MATTRKNDAAEATEAAARTAGDEAQETVERGTAAARKAAEDTSETLNRTAEATREASAKFGNLVADSQRNLNEQFEKFTRGLESFSTFGQDNIEAMVKSSEIAARALEGIGSEISAYSRRYFEDGVAAAQDFASARTMTELFEKQTAYAQTAFEGWLHQTTKMNEIFVAAAKDMSAPLGDRFNAAQEAARRFAA